MRAEVGRRLGKRKINAKKKLEREENQEEKKKPRRSRQSPVILLFASLVLQPCQRSRQLDGDDKEMTKKEDTMLGEDGERILCCVSERSPFAGGHSFCVYFIMIIFARFLFLAKAVVVGARRERRLFFFESVSVCLASVSRLHLEFIFKSQLGKSFFLFWGKRERNLPDPSSLGGNKGRFGDAVGDGRWGRWTGEKRRRHGSAETMGLHRRSARCCTVALFTILRIWAV